MKHTTISLVALAAAALAGCGGGSDNGGGGPGEGGPVTLSAPDRSRLNDHVGQTYTIAAGKTANVTVDGGEIVFSGCPDGCSVTVSRNSSGTVVAMSSVKGVRARFTPTQPPPAQPPNTVTQEEANQRENTARQEGVQAGRAQAELEQRAPKWVAALDGLGSGGAADSGEFAQYSGVTVSHMRGGKRTVQPNAFTGSGPTPPSISGFTPASFAQKGGIRNTHDQTIYLYTNIGSPNSRPFWKVHGNTATGLPVTVSTESGEEGMVTVTAPAPGTSNSIRVTGTTPTFSIGSGTPSVTNHDEARIAATYGGISGHLVCRGVGSQCAGNAKGSAGKLIVGTSTATWSFVPNSFTSFLQRDQDDTYLFFGIWASEPESPDGIPDLGWISGGDSGAISEANFSNLDGKATFTGGVIGQYAIDKTGSGGNVKAGIFTAAAKFEATFDDGSTSDTLSGQIETFKERDGSSLTGWRLYLGGASNADTTPLTAAGTGGAIAGAVGKVDGVDVSGSWMATLHGADNGTAPDNVKCPEPGCAADLAGVTGWFRANGTGVNANNDGDPPVLEPVAVSGTVPAIVSIAGAFAAD